MQHIGKGKRVALEISDLITQLPRGSAKYQVVDKNIGITYIENPYPLFVSPEFSQQQSEAGAQVILIVAPAGTGKTKVAEELAARTSSLYYDLANTQVGGNTFAGAITNAMGYQAGPEILKSLQQGSNAIVVDALDEADVRAGSKNFAAFVQELCRFGRSAVGRPSLVLMARSVTAEWIQLTFLEESVPLQVVSIDPFTRELAEEFIDKQLDAEYDCWNRARAHRENPIPFRQARELLFDRIYSVFSVSSDLAWANSDLRRFLGYAPVLEALSKYLHVDNHQKLVEHLKSPNANVVTGDREWRLMMQIVEDLLLREQDKTVSQILPQLEDSEILAVQGSLYTPEEQCARLLSRVIPSLPRPVLPVSLPEEHRRIYEDAALTAMENHPCLDPSGKFVNIVFRDYVFAHALLGPGLAADSARAVRERLMRSEYLPSPLLANFLIGLSHGSEIGEIDGRDAGFVLESVGSRLQPGESVYSYFVGSVDGRPGVASIGILHAERSMSTISFRFTDSSGMLFPSRLSNCTVMTTGHLELGGRGNSIAVGPDVSLTCLELLIASQDVQLRTSAEGDIELNAIDFLGAPVQDITHFGDGSVRCSWPEISYPWIRFHAPWVSPMEKKEEYDALQQFASELRRIIVRFKNRRGGLLTIHKELLENLVIKTNAVARNVVAALKSDGAIEENMDEYVLRLEFLQRAGINYADVRENKLSETFLAYASKLMKM